MTGKHYVVCKLCGMKFDYKSTGGYFDGNRYVCKSCANKEIRYERALQENQRKGLPSSSPVDTRTWWQKYWKVVIGLVMLFGSFGNIGKENEAAGTGIIIGIAILAWHFLPALLSDRKKEVEAKASLKKEAERKFVCSRCGAMTTGKNCSYCGSPIIDNG